MADTDGIMFFERAVANEFIDLSKLLTTITNVSTEFYGELSDGDPADQFKVEWESDTINAQTVTLNGGINNAVTTIAVATGHSARLRVGSVLQNTENIAADATADSQAERLVVTAITSDSDITVATRGALGSTAKAHTDAAVFNILAHSPSEVSSVPSDRSTDRGTEYNYCQIFTDAVLTSWVRKFMKSATVPDEEAYQIVQRSIEMLEQFDRTALNGMRGYATDGAGDRHYYMNGVLPVVVAGGNIVSSAENLSAVAINALNAKVKDAARQHELPTRLTARDNVIRYISRFGEQYIRYSLSDKIRGQYVTEFKTDEGNVLQLVADKNMPAGHILLHNPINVRRRPLIPLGLFRMPLAKTADSVLLMSVWSLEVRGASSLFAAHTNITVP